MVTPLTSLGRNLLAEIEKRYLNSPQVERLPSERQLVGELKTSRVALRPVLAYLEETERVFQRPGGRIRYIRPSPGDSCEAEDHAPWDPLERAAFSRPQDDANHHLRIMLMDLCPGSAVGIRTRWECWAEAFHAEHPSASLELVPWNLNAHWTMSRIVENLEGVDLLQAPSWFGPELVQQGWAQPLTFSGRQLSGDGLPYGSSLPCLLAHRPTVAFYLGKQVPTRWSWREFLDATQLLTQDRESPLIMHWFTTHLLSSCGILPLNKRSPTSAQVALLQRILDRTFPQEPFNLDRVASGVVPFWPTLISGLPGLLERNRHQDLCVLPYPCEPDGHVLEMGMELFQSAHTPRPLEAWEAIAWLTADKRQDELADSYHLLPARPESRALMAQRHCPLGPLDIFTSLASHSKPANREQSGQSESRLLFPEVEAVLNGKQSATEAIVRLQLRQEIEAARLTTRTVNIAS